METIEIPISEYDNLKKELSLLRNQDLLLKLNDMINLMYSNKVGLYMGNYFDDLTEVSIDNLEEWQKSGDVWNDI